VYIAIRHENKMDSPRAVLIIKPDRRNQMQVDLFEFTITDYQNVIYLF